MHRAQGKFFKRSVLYEKHIYIADLLTDNWTTSNLLFKEKSQAAFDEISSRIEVYSKNKPEKVLYAAVKPEITETFLDPEWQEGVQNLSASKLADLILIASDIDPDTLNGIYWTCRTHHSKKNHLTVEHLEILANPRIIAEITDKNYRDLINITVRGFFPDPEDLDSFIYKNQHFLTKDNSNIYEKIVNETIWLDDISIDFLANKISLNLYYDRYLALDEEWQDEFWNWAELRELVREKNREAKKLLNNHQKGANLAKGNNQNALDMFFELVDKADELDLSLSNVIFRRKLIEDGNEDDVFNISEYNYPAEMNQILRKMADYKPKKLRLKEKTNNHHVFFPESAYKSDRNMKRFRNKAENRVQILVNSHNQMNRRFEYLGKKYDYKIPILSLDMIHLITKRRTLFAYDYMNFLELMRVVCGICIEFGKEVQKRRRVDGDKINEEVAYNEKIFNEAIEVFHFLKAQSRFVTNKTVSPNTSKK